MSPWGLRRLDDEEVELADEVAFEAADDFPFRFALDGASGSVVSGCLVIAQPHDDDVVDRRIRLAITGPVEPVDGSFFPDDA